MHQSWKVVVEVDDKKCTAWYVARNEADAMIRAA